LSDVALSLELSDGIILLAFGEKGDIFVHVCVVFFLFDYPCGLLLNIPHGIIYV
jgi:hypothetical protein